MQSVQSDADPDAARYGRFASRLTAGLERSELRCATAAQLGQLVDESLRQVGMTGWTAVDEGGYDAAGGAATAGPRAVAILTRETWRRRVAA